MAKNHVPITLSSQKLVVCWSKNTLFWCIKWGSSTSFSTIWSHFDDPINSIQFNRFVPSKIRFSKIEVSPKAMLSQSIVIENQHSGHHLKFCFSQILSTKICPSDILWKHSKLVSRYSFFHSPLQWDKIYLYQASVRLKCLLIGIDYW